MNLNKLNNKLKKVIKMNLNKSKLKLAVYLKETLIREGYSYDYSFGYSDGFVKGLSEIEVMWYLNREESEWESLIFEMDEFCFAG